MNILYFIFYIVAGTFGMLYFTWLLYQAVMNLQRARDNGTLPRPAYYLGLPILAVGLFWDFLTNVTVVNLIFLERPRELLITSRLERHAFGPDGWRKNLARWFAANLLDPFDPRGTHVRE